MNQLKDCPGGKTKASPRLRHLAIVVAVITVVTVVLTAFGHARMHASVSNSARSDSNSGENSSSTAISFHTRVATRSEAPLPDAEQKQSDATIIVHGSLDGDLRPTDHARWRQWLQ